MNDAERLRAAIKQFVVASIKAHEAYKHSGGASWETNRTCRNADTILRAADLELDAAIKQFTK